MGAPKQKWTPEEEAALKAGVIKHGPGKWRTILKDPQFSGVLYLRSNVDLKVLLNSDDDFDFQERIVSNFVIIFFDAG